MNDAARPFTDSVDLTRNWLRAALLRRHPAHRRAYAVRVPVLRGAVAPQAAAAWNRHGRRPPAYDAHPPVGLLRRRAGHRVPRLGGAGGRARHPACRRARAAGPAPVHVRASARPRDLHPRGLRLLPHSADAPDRLRRRPAAPLGPRLRARRLRLRPPAPARHQPHRAGPAQYRRAAARPRVAPGAPLPAARRDAAIHHAAVPVAVRSEDQPRAAPAFASRSAPGHVRSCPRRKAWTSSSTC